MIKHGIIFTGLMVLTSAAGFALSFSHDAVTKNRSMSMAASAEPADLVQPAKNAPHPVAKAEPVLATALAPASVNVVIATPVAPSPVVSSQTSLAQDSALTPVAASLRPRMRADSAASAPRPTPATARIDPPLRTGTAPLAMNLPVYSYNDSRSTQPAPVLRPSTIPSPRYLIGVYR